jgi:hypothetical protein
MPRTFAYVRVSTVGQTTENQIQEIEAAGAKPLQLEQLPPRGGGQEARARACSNVCGDHLRFSYARCQPARPGGPASVLIRSEQGR